MKMYRAVSDFGYGDKSWVFRFLSEKEAIDWYNRENRANADNINECMDDSRLHYIEEDSASDEEDWDWMES